MHRLLLSGATFSNTIHCYIFSFPSSDLTKAIIRHVVACDAAELIINTLSQRKLFESESEMNLFSINEVSSSSHVLSGHQSKKNKPLKKICFWSTIKSMCFKLGPSKEDEGNFPQSNMVSCQDRWKISVMINYCVCLSPAGVFTQSKG